MENNNVFFYRYSAAQSKEAEDIRKKYLPVEEDKLDVLRKLDRRAQSAGMAESLSLGVIGCLIFGIGMCFGLDVFAGADWLSVLFAALGVALMLPAYPLFKHISEKTKAELAPEILRISDELIKN
ncbi:MAG: hypothetical protein IJW21_00020 [Clostridia bacterium]|nr:hypothetical protein [Clostridia bacterium]